MVWCGVVGCLRVGVVVAAYLNLPNGGEPQNINSLFFWDHVFRDFVCPVFCAVAAAVCFARPDMRTQMRTRMRTQIGVAQMRTQMRTQIAGPKFSTRLLVVFRIFSVRTFVCAVSDCISFSGSIGFEFRLRDFVSPNSVARAAPISFRPIASPGQHRIAFRCPGGQFGNRASKKNQKQKSRNFGPHFGDIYVG